MGAVRTCVLLFVVLVSSHRSVSKPFFGSLLLCDLWCDDDDVTTSTSTSTEDIFDLLFNPCDCATSSTSRPNGAGQPFNIVIPPMNNALGVTVDNRNGSWFLNLNPMGGSAVTPAPGAATTAAGTTAGTTGGTTAATTTTKK